MSYFLGMDVGGTHSRAVLVSREGHVAGLGTAGSANRHNMGLGVAREHLIEAVEGAWSSVGGKKHRPAEYAFLGCAGVKSDTEKSEIRALAESAGLAPKANIRIENDLYNALAGGLSGRPGIALIAGTGSNCLGRDAHGKTVMCGGWGWLLDDQGAAFGLAISAVRAALRAADGRTGETSLLPAVLAFFGVSGPDDLSACFYVKQWTPDAVAKFAPEVVRQAADGDAMAQEILVLGARALAELVAGAARVLDFPEVQGEGPEVVLLGSCVRSGPPYQDRVEKEIRSIRPAVRLVEPEGSTLTGAAYNALRYGGVEPVPKIDPGVFDL